MRTGLVRLGAATATAAGIIGLYVAISPGREHLVRILIVAGVVVAAVVLDMVRSSRTTSDETRLPWKRPDR